jgi:hypothetical protein
VSTEPPPPAQVSPDGKFYWDGQRWVPTQQTGGASMSGVPNVSSNVGQLSPDGKFYWDGQQWMPVTVMTPKSPGRRRPRESSVWVGVGALLIMIIQAPLAIIFTFGIIGLVILWAVSGSLGNALRFDLYFVLWSVGAMLPILPAYCIGALIRLIAWNKPMDSFAQMTAMVAGFGCFLIGVDMFFLGWSRFDTFTYWLGWGVVALFLLSYLGGFAAGWTGASRELRE